MAFRDNVASDLDLFLNGDDFATPVLYIGSGGVSKEILAVFLTKTDLLMEGIGGVESSLPAVLVKRSDVDGIANGDLFEIEGVRYTVIQTEYRDDLILKAYLSKDTRPLF